jgi:hypothetical protein
MAVPRRSPATSRSWWKGSHAPSAPLAERAAGRARPAPVYRPHIQPATDVPRPPALHHPASSVRPPHLPGSRHRQRGRDRPSSRAR